LNFCLLFLLPPGRISTDELEAILLSVQSAGGFAATGVSLRVPDDWRRTGKLWELVSLFFPRKNSATLHMSCLQRQTRSEWSEYLWHHRGGAKMSREFCVCEYFIGPRPALCRLFTACSGSCHLGREAALSFGWPGTELNIAGVASSKSFTAATLGPEPRQQEQDSCAPVSHAKPTTVVEGRRATKPGVTLCLFTSQSSMLGLVPSRHHGVQAKWFPHKEKCANCQHC
jgi:hypothetical protein